MNWEAIGVGIASVLAIVGFNAWCMRLVIDNSIAKNMILIMEKYATKEELEKHISHCPNRQAT